MDNSIYDKYRKMAKMGIPKPAIKIKIEMDGLEYSDDIFTGSPKFKANSIRKINNNNYKNPNPEKNNKPQLSLNDMLKNNFKNGDFKSKLKKTETIKRKSPNKYKPPVNMNVPTLSEIQSALKSLKKTKK